MCKIEITSIELLEAEEMEQKYKFNVDLSSNFDPGFPVFNLLSQAYLITLVDL